MRQWKKLLLASVLLLSALLLLGSVRQPAEPHLLPAEEYRLISPLTYRYLLSPPGPCRDSSPFLVLLVPVAPQQAAARRAVRGTWGAPRVGTLTLFFSGIPAEGLQSPQQRALEEESAQHADIIQMDFMDSYQNLTIKTLMMMGWLGAHCPGAPYAMKVDSDIFLNIFHLLRRLRTAPRAGFITGSVISDGRPRRDPSSKWFLSERLFPEERFPPYVSGAAYVFSSDMAPRISWASRFVRPIPLEDVYVGLCLRLLGVRPVYSLSLPLFRNLFQLQKLQYDRCSFSRIIIVNGFQPAELLRIWPDFSAGQAACL
ncbi:PREDICTED: beta-1,3-galactosyltransferase 2-like [Cyprinodon variegatus]|uniref:beta-1,3-galactosyltransferase 2-like n=1 Tax=Cyprinodon variegatus TaxID=28743 RepID=UPI000742BB47|nr:PREDICTED: beta-1,3-galactosyltransferase 2-like [Cyprinodon variegatus]